MALMEISTADRVAFTGYLAQADMLLTEAPASRAVTDGRVELRDLSLVFTGDDCRQEAAAARTALSNVVDKLVDTAIVQEGHTGLTLDEHINEAIGCIGQAVDVLRDYLGEP
jgi:hypothetical protein